MHDQSESHHLKYTPKTQRPLHWCIIVVSLLFVFLLVIESVTFIVLGAWHFTVRFQQPILVFFTEVHQRELALGILLIIIGSLGILISILGLIALFTLRLLLLRLFSWCLWLMMIVGSATGILGIIFASQVDGFIRQMNVENVNNKPYGEEKFMFGMNGGLSLFMSLTLLIGIIVVRCLNDNINSYTIDHSYLRAQ